ncbi:phosphatase PAP2 family protein [Paenibacillus segetis]|uniref:phosphatase PAP2 family protein n=1 Tax=Paenibacillus segetis TaxID=1325360 RepID=UPI001667E6CC|nr:phosphatase PAP2 family protein [Paenibacillus segetis]
MYHIRQSFNKSYLLALSLLSSIGFMSIFYTVLNTDQGQAHALWSPIDNLLPLLPAMSIPYLAWYPYIFIAMAYLCLKDRKTYFRTLLSMNISLVVCYIIYYYFQTTVIRPPIKTDRWSTRLLSTIYNRDQPFNCFPSIHALHSYLIMRAAWISKSLSSRTKMIFTASSLIIIASTLLIKQHVIYDAVSAALLGEAIFTLIGIRNVTLHHGPRTYKPFFH